MPAPINQNVDPLARTVDIGDAPITQTGAGGQWVNAWSKTGVTALHKANVTNAGESWIAVKYTDLLSSSLMGGDLYGGDLGVSGQSAATSSVKQEIDGKEGLRFNLAESASTVSINLSSFFVNDDNMGYVEGARIRLYDAVGTLVGESFVQATSSTGTQSVQLSSNVAFRSVEISAGARNADGIFSFGGYTDSQGAFASDLFADARNVKHGSDFLVDKVTFEIARPVSAGDSYSIDEDAGLQSFASVLANDKDADGAALTASLVTGPSHGALSLNADGTVSYQADADYFGNDTFTYRAFNGKDYSNDVAVQLAVRSINDAPVAASDSASVTEDSSANAIDVLANDVAGPANEASQHLAVTAASAEHGTVAIDAEGRLLYTPNANFFGADTITYTVADDGSTNGAADPRSANGQVNVTVDGVNDAPAAGNDSAATDEDTTVSGNVLTGANGGLDTDPDGDSLTVTTTGTFTTALGAALTLSANGTFVYNPTGSATLQAMAAGASQVDGFDYTVSDGHGGTSVGHVDVTVAGRAEPTPPVSATILPSVEPGAQLDYYLRYTDNSGVSKWLQVNSFAVGAHAETSFAKGAGASVGAPVPGEFTTVLGSSPAVTDFLQKILQGATFKSVELEAYAPGGKGLPALVQEYKLGDAFVTSVQTEGDSIATSTNLSFVYKTFGAAVSPLDRLGAPTVASTFGWDIPAGLTGVGLPDPGPDARLNDLGSQLPVDAQLDYYVHIDGINGWFALGDFSMGYEAGTSWTKGGGVAAGKPVPTDLKLEMGSSQAVNALLQNLVTGRQNNAIQVEVYAHPGGKSGAQLVDEYFFNSAFTTGVDSSEGGDNKLSFVYKSFTHSHLTYTTTGAMDNLNSNNVGYDIARAQLISAPTPAAEAVNNGTAVLLPSVEPDVRLDYYLRYTDNSGASKWLRVEKFDVGVKAETSFANGSGASVGKPVPGEFTTVLGSSPAVSDFLEKILQGSSFKSVELEAYTLGRRGEPALVQEYKLGNVFVTSMQTQGQAESTSNTLSFVYQTFGEAVSPLNGQGAPTVASTFGWDIPAGMTGVGMPDPGPDARLDDQGSQLPVDTQLEYYVHIDGINGWFSLSKFGMGYEADTSWTKGSGAAVGKPVPSDLNLEMGSSQAVTALLQNLITGRQNNAIQVEAYANTGAKGGLQLVDEYFFNSAFTTGVNSAEVGYNALSFVYRSFTHSHLAYTNTGAVDSANSNNVGYDIVTSQLIGAPAPAAEAVSHGTAVLLPSVEPGPQLDYYLRYTDKSGVSKWLQVNSFDVGAHAATSIASAGGASVGKPVPGEFKTVLGSSPAVLDFLEKILVGGSFTSVELEAYAPGGKGAPALVQEYKLGDVFVTSVQTEGHGTTTSNTLSFVYKTFGEAVAPLDHGAPTVPSTLGWDIPEGTTGVGLPDPGPDVRLNDLGSQLPVDAQLEYYVHIDGINGWFALSEFSLGYEANTSWTKGGGAAVGAPVPNDLKLEMGSSQAVNALLQNLVTGHQNNSIQVEVYANTGAKFGNQLLDEYFFNSAFTTGVDSGEAGHNSLSFVYQSFTHSHLAYTTTGAVDSANSNHVGYDLVTAQLIGAPAPHADVFP